MEIREARAGVMFRGDVGMCYRSCLWLRTAIRIRQRLASGFLQGGHVGDELYQMTRDLVPWADVLGGTDATFSVDATAARNPDVRNTTIIKTRVRDAICDAVRDTTGLRPAPPTGVADVPLHVSVYGPEVVFWRDLSGTSLHKRGYRSVVHKAALNEVAAAGILQLAGWDEICAQADDAVLVDPMCGSGTFLVEAAMMAARQPPGLWRADWPFLRWPDADQVVWRAELDRAKELAHAGKRDSRHVIVGSEIHPGAVALARECASRAGAGNVAIRHGNCVSWRLPRAPDVIVTNPPWGRRLHDERGARRGHEDENEALAGAWRDLASFFREQCGGSRAYILSGNKDVTRHLRMKAAQRHPLTLGSVDCRLIEYYILPPKRD
ncbi:unnamed protein product [Pedinophyceae sp. YPF-701]|nr:unnamed protein product [Pedinophyceae sp. YPF-701]